MIDPFLKERRFFAIVHSYIDLVGSIPALRVYSGADKFYTLFGLGVKASQLVDTPNLKIALAKDGIAFQDPLPYLIHAISMNCLCYAKILISLIETRLETRGTQDQPVNGGVTKRLSYNVTPFLAQQLNKLADPYDRIRATQGVETTLQNLCDMALLEYTHVSKQDGMVSLNPRQDQIIKAFCYSPLWLMENTDPMIDPRTRSIPLLATYLVLARLLYADFHKNRPVAPIPSIDNRLKISDTLLAALPWPNRELAEQYYEADASYISTPGWIYLHRASQMYPIQSSS